LNRCYDGPRAKGTPHDTRSAITWLARRAPYTRERTICRRHLGCRVRTIAFEVNARRAPRLRAQAVLQRAAWTREAALDTSSGISIALVGDLDRSSTCASTRSRHALSPRLTYRFSVKKNEPRLSNDDLRRMSIDELWDLHQRLTSTLEGKIEAELQQIEAKLKALQQPKSRRKRGLPKPSD